VTSAEVDGRSIVGVVMGSSSGGKRNETMKSLVARYLPKATRSGESNFVVAKNNTSSEPPEVTAVASSVDLPSSGPLPVVRYDSEGVETAYATTATENPAAAALRATATAQPVTSIPVPEPAPAYMPRSPG